MARRGTNRLVRGFQRQHRHIMAAQGRHPVAAFGQVLGVQLANAAAAALREARGAANGLARAGADYVTEETGDVVARAELTAFHDQVDGLRDDVERIAARVSRLAQAGVAS